MERGGRDFKCEPADVDRAHDPSNICGIVAVKYHQESAMVIGESMVQVNDESMRFFSDQIIVMYADPLTFEKFVRDNADGLFEGSSEYFHHL